MKYCVIIFFGLAIQLDAYLIQRNDTLQMGNGSSQPDLGTLKHSNDSGHRRSMMSDDEEAGYPSDQEPRPIDRRTDISFGLDTGAQKGNVPVSKAVEVLKQAYDKHFKPQIDKHFVNRALDGVGGSETNRVLSVELKSKSILDKVEGFLASDTVKQAAKEIAKKAAIMYKAVVKVL